METRGMKKLRLNENRPQKIKKITKKKEITNRRKPTQTKTKKKYKQIYKKRKHTLTPTIEQIYKKKRNLTPTIEQIQNIEKRNITPTIEQIQNIEKLKLQHFICSDNGTCLAFGNNVDKIKKMFNDFVDFKFARRMKRIGAQSANGFVTQIEYLTDDVHPYKSYAVLKSSASKTADNPTPDNLYYEYLVGKLFINRQTKIFPCFLETYGSFFYKTEDSYDKIKDLIRNEYTPAGILSDQLDFIPKITDPVINLSCRDSQYVAILVENIKDVKSLGDYLKDDNFLIYDLLGVLYQIYLPLSKLFDTFTHYDLHTENVLVYKPFSDKYITYNYHISKGRSIKFKSKYLVKIIDYGRSFFDNGVVSSRNIYNVLCNQPLCNNIDSICGDGQGYWLDNQPGSKKNDYITPIRANMSHDLRLLKIIKEKIDSDIKIYHSIETKYKKNMLKVIKKNPIFALLNKIIISTKYDTKYGTPQIVKYTQNILYNVSDAYDDIEELIVNANTIRQNDEYYQDYTFGGELNIYMDKPMKFINFYNMKSVDNTTPNPKPRIETF